MELWEQLLYAGAILMMLFIFFPSVRGAIERSKHAKEKHWGTVITLTAVLIIFVLFLMYMVQ